MPPRDTRSGEFDVEALTVHLKEEKILNESGPNAKGSTVRLGATIRIGVIVSDKGKWPARRLDWPGPSEIGAADETSYRR